MADARLSNEFYHFVYDPRLYGYKTSFFTTITGAPAISGNKIRLNAASFQTLEQYYLGDYEFLLTIPTAPTLGDSRQFGIKSLTLGNTYSAYFSISGTSFQTITYGETGSTIQATTVGWVADWTNTEATYKIRWRIDRVEFLVNNIIVATHFQNSANTLSIPRNISLPLYVLNANADNMDLTYIKFVGISKQEYLKDIINATVNVGNVAVTVADSAAATSTGGTVVATNAAGGTTIVAANAKRKYTQVQNNGAVDVYFGAGAVTSSFPKIIPNGVFTWDSQEALKVLSSGADANIAFVDYINN